MSSCVLCGLGIVKRTDKNLMMVEGAILSSRGIAVFGVLTGKSIPRTSVEASVTSEDIEEKEEDNSTLPNRTSIDQWPSTLT